MAITRKTTPYIEWIFDKEELDVSTLSWYIIRLESRSFSIEKDNTNLDVETNIESNSITINLTWEETGGFKDNEKIRMQIYFDIDGFRNSTYIYDTCVAELLDFQDERLN